MKRKKMMKKVMTFMAMLGVAGMVQAASINWQSGNLYLPTSATDGTWSSVNKVAAGTVTAYYYLISAAEYNSATLLSDTAALVESGAFTGAGATATVVASGSLNRAANYTQSGLAAGDTAYILVVYVLDSVAASFDQQWYEVNKATATINAAGNNATVANLAASIAEWTPVPEPTSAALLAFGAAVVGLRRKFRK